MDCTVKRVYKNSRYRLINFNNEYYLIDLDENKILFIFPFLFYFFTHKMYKVNNDEVMNLVIPKNFKKNAERLKEATKLAPFIGVASVPFFKNIDITNYLNINIDIDKKIVIIIISIFFCIFLKIIILKRTDPRVAHITKEKKHIDVKFVEDIKFHIKILYLSIFDILFSLSASYIFIIYGNLFMLGASIIFTYLYISWTRTFFPHEAQINIKFKEGT